MGQQISSHGQVHHRQDGYEEFLRDIRAKFNAVTTRNDALFATDARDLFKIFISGLPPHLQQHYTCDACYQFVEKFGGVVAINPRGHIISAMWGGTAPLLYRQAVEEIKRAVEGSKVKGVFYAGGDQWGKPVTGDWHHMAVSAGRAEFTHPLKTAGQMMAEKREDYKLLISALKEYPLEAVKVALSVLKTDALHRSEKVVGVAQWFKDIHTETADVKNNRIKSNLIWRAVATAPAGFCHIKNSMLGTLMLDIIDIDGYGYSFEEISNRFSEKMHPLQYQRPQAAPTGGNIAQAEKIMDKYKAAGSLERRFARLDELELLWEPKARPPAPTAGAEGVFSHIKPKGQPPVNQLAIPPITMTWRKFKEEILPTADRLEFFAHHQADNYAALVTAVNSQSPPILQWDLPMVRNPVSWYLYDKGSFPTEWDLIQSTYVKVAGICFKPTMWNGNSLSHQGKGIFFILAGAFDTRYESSGNALFPETLKSEFREIRATIEAYSRSAVLQEADEATACGVLKREGDNWSPNVSLRVFDDCGQTDYKLDRWD